MRVLFHFLYRVRNRISAYINRLRLTIYGIRYGSNCVIHGKLYIKLFPTAKCIIGDNLYFSSGWNVNALCTNKRGTIYATDCAIITIGNNVGMSSTVLWAHKEIKIGNNVKIGGNCVIIDTDSHSIDYLKRRNPDTDWGIAKSVVIEDDVMLGMNTIVLKGVTIGTRTVVGAGSVVTKDLPPDCIAGGNPAKVIRYVKNNMCYANYS